MAAVLRLINPLGLRLLPAGVSSETAEGPVPAPAPPPPPAAQQHATGDSPVQNFVGAAASEADSREAGQSRAATGAQLARPRPGVSSGPRATGPQAALP